MELLLQAFVWITEIRRKREAMSKLRKAMPELLALRNQLKEIAKNPEPLRAIVDFFDIISKWEDSDTVESLYLAFCKLESDPRRAGAARASLVLGIQQNTMQLMDHVFVAGRSRSGMNRTEVGQKVTPDDVYLGNINGLPIHTASYWLARKKDENYGVVATHARFFMIEHIHSMSKAIEHLAKRV